MLYHIDNFYITDVKPTILDKSDEVHALLQKSYWAKDRTPSVTRKAIENSLNYAVFESTTDRLVGYARVVTDYATVYYLCDVYIEEAYRGKGLGKELIKWICVHEDKLSGANGLLKTRDAQGLYEKFEFEECQSTCMVKLYQG